MSGSAEPLLEAHDLGLALGDRATRRLWRAAPPVHILHGIGLRLATGETLGIVGESGSGKTTLGRTLLRLHEPSAGSIRFAGVDITHADESVLRPLRARMQLIFQDPSSALNPRHRIGAIVTQPLVAYRRIGTRAERRRAAHALLGQVGLPTAFAERYPHELSGGQRQRVGIARAIAPRPELVVADEITAGLDVSSQAQILALLRALREAMGLALILISHDLSVVRVVCDRVLVLQRGRVVEAGPCAELFANPRHPYTRRLRDAIPLPTAEPGWLDGAEPAD